MKKLSRDLLYNNGNYVAAMDQAIEGWKNAKTFEDKTNYLIAIGEIGVEIHKMNRTLEIK